MNYLLDTHTFLWSLFSREKISHKSQDIILNSDNEITVSIITFWEISLKYNLGRLELSNIKPDDLPDVAKKSGFSIFPVNEYDASSFHNLPREIHKDPFDRLLIWQAIRNGFTIISKDTRFNEYSKFGLRVLW